MTTSKCRSCGAKIIWMKTMKGRMVPLDAEPVATGNIVIRDGIAEYVHPSELAYENEERYVSHFSSCPQAKEWRKK